jgi:hypothetical protein
VSGWPDSPRATSAKSAAFDFGASLASPRASTTLYDASAKRMEDQ